MTTSVIWHHNDGFWDTALPKYILGRMGLCHYFQGLEWAKELAGSNQGVIVIPGRHSCNDYDKLNEAGKSFKRLVFLIIGDEEGIFHSDRLEHPKMKIWWLMPPFHPKQKVDRVGPNGWPTDAPMMIEYARKRNHGIRPLDWSFYGQMTHMRRIQCVNATQGLKNGQLLPTNGFTQGVPRDQYYEVMVRSKFVLCPSGPCTPDSFRFAEALEAGCVPIVDNLTQHTDYPPGYWAYALDREVMPFPVVEDWSQLEDLIELCLFDWEARAKRCRVWWEAFKEGLVNKMREDLSG